ncbi:MAG: hypothetical protein IPK22_11230 [Verrucomicrobiaceae bacterium]|nr:hypothetical protein [Verrucomicrobiaceae bacterium]
MNSILRAAHERHAADRFREHKHNAALPPRMRLIAAEMERQSRRCSALWLHLKPET